MTNISNNGIGSAKNARTQQTQQTVETSSGAAATSSDLAEQLEEMSLGQPAASYEGNGNSIGGSADAPAHSPAPRDAHLKGELQQLRATGGASSARMRSVDAPSMKDVSEGAELALGQKGPAVLWLQEELNRMGASPPLTCDGDFGPRTQAALKQLQQEHGAAPTGVFGGPVRSTLDDALHYDLNAWLADHAVDATPPPNVGSTPGIVVPSWRQGDFKVPLGHSDKTIATHGCMLTSFSMIVAQMTGRGDLPPDQMNDYMRTHNGFIGANLNITPGAKSLGLKTERFNCFGENTGTGSQSIGADAMRARLDASLAAGKPVMLGVDYADGASAKEVDGNQKPNHWVVITGKNPDGSYTVKDPATGKDLVMNVDEQGRLHRPGSKSGKEYTGTEMIFFSKEHE
jgi:peptidoglycan hydrolase-like protein with peptidoglycan-binding domain